ncbi:MAG: hypothetical protein NTY01_18095, partial [Verrucomicrobia bacterium]|nr:hypothetical protein [Verrucomicrobiota bacterium]
MKINEACESHFKRAVITFVSGFFLLPMALLAGEPADWIKDVTNLLVGPMKTNSLPAGKTLEAL